MDVDFRAVVFEWRGPAPFHFVRVPDAEAELLASVAPAVSYGWGMVPATVTVGATSVTTALWPKDGGYVVPVKDALRRPERIELGDEIGVRLHVDV